MANSHASESSRGLLPRHRRRTGLTQRDLAARAGVSLRSVQDWEAGVTLPTAERLQALVRALLEAQALTPGLEMSEAREFWTPVVLGCTPPSTRSGSRACSPPMRLPTRHAMARSTPSPRAEASTGGAERARDCGEAPRGEPLATLHGHTGAVWRVALAGNGRSLASGSPDGMVRLWEAPSGQPLATLEGHAGAVWGVALSRGRADTGPRR